MSGDESWVGPPTTAISRAGSEPVALGAAHDLPRVGQCGETFIQGASADAAQRAQFPDGKWAVRCRDRGSDSFVDGGRRGGRSRDRLEDFEGQRVAALCEFECDRGWRRRGAVFNGEREFVT